MQLPIVAPAPVVTAHADAFRDLFENRCQFQHFQHYLTGLMVLANKRLTNIARCVLASADKTNLARFLAEAPWKEALVNDRRMYRRYEEITQWEGFVTNHFPDRTIPTQKKARAQLHKEIDPTLLQDPAFAALHQQFR